jgi:hypothetical protein
VTQRETPDRSGTPSARATSQAAGQSTSGLANAANDGVISAFVLGWHVAELFHLDLPRSVRRRQVSLEKLAGIGELDPLSQAKLLLAQVQVDLQRAWRMAAIDRQHPDAIPVQSLLEAEMRSPGQMQAAVAELHRQLLVALTAADFRLGKAYGLGRALAETALLPDARNPRTFRRALARYRLANLLGWLADLKSAFPPHASEAVRGSLQAWAAWSEAPVLRPAPEEQRRASDVEEHDQAPAAPLARRAISRSWSTKRPSPPQGRPVDWRSATDRESVTRALHRQGQLWRAVLSGEKECLDLLSADDYVRAADRLLGHIRRLTLGFLRRFWISTTALAVILLAAVATVVVVRAASTVVAAVLTAAGAIGLTWKGAASGLGRVLAQAQRPLWESELDAAVAEAITWLPRERRASDRPPEAENLREEADGAAADAGEDQSFGSDDVAETPS